MILLSTATELLQVVTGSSVSSINVQSSYVDLSNVGTVQTPHDLNTLITTATTTTIVGSPAVSTQRAVKNLCIYNSSGSSCAVTIQHYDGTTTVAIFSYVMLAGESVYWSEGRGFYILDTHGNLKVTTSGSSSTVFYTVTSQTSNYAANSGDDVWCTGTFAVTLPAVGNTTRIKVTNRGTGMITISPASGTINGNASLTIARQYSSAEFASNGTNWDIE
jgi:hypothetical protein